MTMTSDVDTAAIQARVTKILTDPKNEWPAIEREATTVEKLYKGYIIPLAAIGPIARLIGFSVIDGGAFRVPFTYGVRGAIVEYVLALLGTFVLALIIDALAPTFGGQKSQIQALKVAAYSSTAAWVAGIFLILPPLAILSIVGLYSLFLLYLGLPVLMKAPQDKAVGYTVVVILVAIVLYFVIGIIVAQFAWRPAMGMPGL